MGDMVLKCPLCCENTFESKSELTEHLATLLDNIVCPICSMKWPNVAQLIEHLSLDNCQLQNTVLPIHSDANTEPMIRENNVMNIKQNLEDAQIIQIENESEKELSDPLTINENIEEGSNMERMYVEFLSKQLTKSCLQTQELKLVKDDGGISRYVFVMNENNENNIDIESAVVTKQNNDGTISLTTVRDMKTESDQTVSQPSPDKEEAQEEIYSCNTCGVSFTSVLEHIQNYHNDQDVVVEEPMEEMRTAPSSTIEYDEQSDTAAIETANTDKHMPRRMITETGDIIEEPVVLKNHSVSLENGRQRITDVRSEKKVRSNSRKHVVVDSVVKEINQPDGKSGPYHKVIMKEMEKSNGEKVKIFNCMSCKIYVSTLDEFKSHPCKQLKYTCTHCPVSYENAKSLCAHMKVHKSRGQDVLPSTTSYSCEICSTVFTNNKSLKLHKRMHDPIKSRPIEPPVESADGTEVSMDKFLCSICNKLIPIDYRTVHQNSHKGKSDFNCDICNKQFQSGEYLEMHMNVHLNEKMPTGRQDKSLPYMCLYCDRRFSRPHEKVKHERIHTGEKPHSCEICGKSFRVSYCLTLHMRTHTGARPYTCKHCGKRFKAHSVYNHHLLTHSEVRAYKCPYCPKAFKTSVQLAGHKNSHTKPFSCQHCNRPFASLYAVRVHTETHSKQNSLKFSCSMCGASYARAFALKDHIKAIHKDAAKADIDKAMNTMLVQQKDGDQITVTHHKDDWGIQTDADENATEITIDEKNLTHQVDMNDVAIVNYNISNELIVP